MQRRGQQSHCEPSAHSKYRLPLIGRAESHTHPRGTMKDREQRESNRRDKKPFSHVEPAHCWLQLSLQDGVFFVFFFYDTRFLSGTHSVSSLFPHDMTALDRFPFFCSPWVATLLENSSQLKNKNATGEALRWRWRAFSVLQAAGRRNDGFWELVLNVNASATLIVIKAA